MSSYADKKSKRDRRRGVKFERHASQIVFDPASLSFVVTWAKCNKPQEERLRVRRAPENWLPSIVAMTTLFDRGRVEPSQVVYAAKTIGMAWRAGDRDGIDTEEAKKAAELVSDLSSMCVDPSSPSVSTDIGQALRHLLDEIASVRFMGTSPSDFNADSIMPTLDKAIAECFSTDGFVTWPAVAKRRRFLFCLNRKERTEVTYTLVSLLFDTGSCPLLSLTDRRKLRMQCAKSSGLDLALTACSASSFFRNAIDTMRKMRESDVSHVKGAMSSKDVLDMVAGASSPTE